MKRKTLLFFLFLLLTIPNFLFAQTVTLNSFNSGGDFLAGSTQNITWTATGTTTNLRLFYSSAGSGGPWTEIDPGTTISAASGTYPWTLPVTLSSNYVIAVDNDAASIDYVISPAFSIVSPISVTSPATGVNWLSNSSQNITWTAPGIANVKIEYSTNDGGAWTTITASVSATPASFSWTVPHLPTAVAKIKVSDVANPSISFTTADFTIGGATITFPTGGEIFASGTTRNITWTSVGTTTNVKLFFSTNGGGNWTEIDPGITKTAASGSYTWTIPNITSSNCKIAIDNSSAGIDYDISAVFSMLGGPVLTYPVDTITGVPIQPELIWTSVAGATGYTVYISTDHSFPGGSTITINAGNTTDIIVSELNKLDQNKTYFWKVVAASSGATSSISSFSTIPAMTVSLYNPLATVYSVTGVQFSWGIAQETGSLRYKLEICQQATTPDTAHWSAGAYALSSNNFTSITLLAGRTYYWRVVVLTPVTISGVTNYRVVAYSDPTSFNTTGGSSVTTYPSWPVGGNTVYDTAPTLYWYLDMYATGIKYQIRYSGNSNATGTVDGFANSLNDGAAYYPTSAGSFSTNLFITFAAGMLTNGHTYYWQVRAYDPATSTYGAWSSVESFYVQGSGSPVTPILSYPRDAVTIYTTAPILYWYLDQAYTGLTFKVYYKKTAPSSGALVGPLDAGTNTFYPLTNLEAGATYEWYVSAVGTTTLTSLHTTFVVAGGTSTTVIISNPSVGEEVFSNTPTVSWYLDGSTLGINGYTVRYKKGSNSSNWNTDYDYTHTISSVYTTSYQLPALDWGATYYWAVLPTGGSGTWVSSNFITTGGTLVSPVLSAPDDGSTVYSTSVNVGWYLNGSNIGVQYYIVDYSPSPSFANPALTQSVNTANATTYNKTLTGLTAGATYWWRVRAYYGGTTYSTSTTTRTFTVNLGSASVVQPILGGPDKISLGTATPTLSWFTPTHTAQGQTYQLEVADNIGFNNSTLYNNVSNNYLAVTGLNDGSYYWRVRSSNNGDYSYYSAVGTFNVVKGTVGIETNNTTLPSSYSLQQNYPNPFNPATNIKFSLPQGSFVTLKIYDVLGRLVKTLISEEMPAGDHMKIWNGDNDFGSKVSSGIYIYQISAGSFHSAKKMTLLK